MTGEITVFTGSAHPEFAEEMCGILGVELSHARTIRFSNDCLQVQLRANCRQRDVYIVQSLVPPVQESLFELLLMLDAARGASAAHITRHPALRIRPVGQEGRTTDLHRGPAGR